MPSTSASRLSGVACTLLLRCAYSCLAPPFQDAEYTTVLPSRVNLAGPA